MTSPVAPDAIDPDGAGNTTQHVDTAPPATSARRVRRGVLWRKWSRLVHVYASMAALLLVLFFGLTGITVNHPDWTFGSDRTTTTESGTFDFAVSTDGEVDFLAVSEALRSQYGIDAPVSDHSTTGDQAAITYRSPGYAADATVDVTTGAYRVTIEQQGWLGVMNELHKGRDAGSSWRWAIDVAGGLLVLIAVSGLVLQLVLHKRRRSALIVVGIGALVAVTLVAITL